MQVVNLKMRSLAHSLTMAYRVLRASAALLSSMMMQT
jgi:hypothetical protein